MGTTASASTSTHNASDQKQRKSNFYDSVYLTEYYDLWVQFNKEELDTRGDATVYLSALRKGLEERPDESVIVLDVGTGTGRVLVNLSNDAVAADTNLDLSRVEFIGVDKEPAMIQRAREVEHNTLSLSQVAKIHWAIGEATNLASLPVLSDNLGHIDLVIFAVGSISHLVMAHEPTQFFRQVAALLRPGTGRAYIPVQVDLISDGPLSEWKPSEGTWAEVQVAQEFHSQLFDGVIYKQYPISASTRDGAIKTDHYDFRVVKQTESGQEELIEKNEIEISLRIWEESQLLQWASGAGLDCIETCHTAHEKFYVFQLHEADPM